MSAKPAVWELEGSAARPEALLDRGLLARLWRYVRPQWRLIAESLALLLVTQVARLVQPTLIALAIDRYLVRAEPAGNWGVVVGAWETFVGRVQGFVPSATGFGVLVAAFVLASLVEYVGRRRQVWLLDLAGQNGLIELRRELFAHLQRLSSAFYDRTAVGRLVGRVTTDIEALQEMFSSGVVTILGDFVNLIAMVAVLLWLSWPLALVAFVVVPLLLWLTVIVRTRVRAAYEVMVSRRSRMSSFLHEHLVGMALVQAFQQERRTADRFGGLNREMRDSQLVAVRWESVLSALTELLGSFATALILWYGGSLIVQRLDPSVDTGGIAAGLTLGTLFMFIDYTAKFFQPLTDLSLKYTVLQNAMTAANKIFSLLDVDEVVPEPASPRAPDRRVGRIEFDSVRFGYGAGDGDEVLHGVSFSVEPGEHVAVVGATGSGKTTLLKLLIRLYDVKDGTIRLDGQDVREFSIADLRSRVGVVPQDVFLFEGTILDNLRLGHPEITEATAIAAADRLRLDRIVARFARGYREPVSERGKNFSSGERQLVAFARALAVAPEVVVLDEATSNVDTQTEELLQGALTELLQERTALIIAHRLSTVRDCDRILVLHEGRLVEEGPHDELLRRRGHYWHLHRMQHRD